MTDYDVPEFARAAMRRFTEQLAEVRTAGIRFSRMTSPDEGDLADRRAAAAETMRRAAESPSASAELRRVAEAVRAGRTSWVAVAAGRARGVPEYDELVARMRERGRALLAAEREAPPPVVVVQDGYDFGASIMRRARD